MTIWVDRGGGGSKRTKGDWEEGGKAGMGMKRLKNAGYVDCGNNSQSREDVVVKILIPGTMARLRGVEVR